MSDKPEHSGHTEETAPRPPWHDEMVKQAKERKPAVTEEMKRKR